MVFNVPLLVMFIALSVSHARAQGGGGGGGNGGGGSGRPNRLVPLVDKRFEYAELPYKIDTDVGLIRGEQAGYNICNSTTEGPTSMCQTAMINSLDDFCFWAPPELGKEVGEIEGEMVAWCTQPGRGTRIIPDGTITGVQFTKAPDYIQVVGFMNQTMINILPGDLGGEMDPHGADRRGNPMGGILFSNAWTGNLTQVVEWHNFMGNDIFCLKACDPSGSSDDLYCEHIFDTQGCVFNAPSDARVGVFESCASDNQAFPGAAPVPPASSLCSTYASTDIYGPSATVRVPIPGAETMTFSDIPRPTPTRTTTPGGSSTRGSTGVPEQTELGNGAWKTQQARSACAISGALALVAGMAIAA